MGLVIVTPANEREEATIERMVRGRNLLNNDLLLARAQTTKVQDDASKVRTTKCKQSSCASTLDQKENSLKRYVP
jgi:predicted patatin/cPLA2 family phospholipase